MAWPGGDKQSPADDFDRPTNLADLATFNAAGDPVNLQRSQIRRALSLPSAPLDTFPQLPPFAPLFSYTAKWRETHILTALLKTSAQLGRVVTPDEADALVYHRAKLCARAAWAPPVVLLTTLAFTYHGRSNFRFPFFTPKPASFNPSFFPTAKRAFLTGPPAVRFWHVLRFGVYGVVCQVVVTGLINSFAKTSYAVGMMRDDRLKAVRELVLRERPRAAGVPGHSPTGEATDSGDVASHQPYNRAFGTRPEQQQQQQQSPQWSQRASEPQDAPQDDGLFDDASPVAPSQRQVPQRRSAPSSPGGTSAWDEIRQRAKSEEGAAWNQGRQQNGESRDQQRTDGQYTYSPAEQEKAYAKEQAQKDFDALGTKRPATHFCGRIFGWCLFCWLVSTTTRLCSTPSIRTMADSVTAGDSTTSTKTPLVITSFPSIPLTTTFTAPGHDCGGIYDPGSPPVLVLDNEPSCLPPGFSTSNSAFFYSPGIACPSGYWTACHDTSGVASITTVTCCPTYGDLSLSCVPSPLSLSEVWESLFCTWQAPPSPGTVITLTRSQDGGRTSTVTERITGNAGINAYGVRMVYQATDLETSSSSASSTAGSSTATTSTNNPGTTSTGGPTDSTSEPASEGGGGGGGSLSAGASAAIGVVVPLVVIGALVLGFLLWRRKKRQLLLQDQQQPPHPPPSSAFYPPTEAAGGGGGYEQQQQQQQQQQFGNHHPKPPGQEEYYHYGNGNGGAPHQPQHPQEMAGHWVPPEMPSTRAAAELPGETAGQPQQPPEYYHHYQQR
ncbi:hypothetical protein C8A00DRAFT_19204 [Chaetomidium leptoderma]|uniref:Uncharacterized protein n=1 Tax=Chaetomidium leptoderma TaxID=669021 RepID=A0AAN6VF84_9PEZI|nr:hypothetical protein C8A00DRAFT_19204 [Chaetomidium leptoderma]